MAEVAGNAMKSPVLAYGGFKSQKCLFLLISLFLVVSPVSASLDKVIPASDVAIYNQTYITHTGGTTPFVVWSGAILLGIILILLSFMSKMFPDGEEGLISILAWIPITYAIYTGFAVDMVTGFGVTSQQGQYVLMESHTVYHFDAVVVCLFILLAFAIGNTFRIWISQRKLRQYSEMDV